MNKREREAEKATRNARQLVSKVRSGFMTERDKEHLMFPLRADDFDFGILRSSSHPFCELIPPGGAGVKFIYFKRDQTIRDMEWNELFRQFPTYRP